MRHPYYEEYFDEKHLKIDKFDIDFDFDQNSLNLELKDIKKMLLKEINEVNSKMGEDEYYLRDGELFVKNIEKKIKTDKKNVKVKTHWL